MSYCAVHGYYVGNTASIECPQCFQAQREKTEAEDACRVAIARIAAAAHLLGKAEAKLAAIKELSEQIPQDAPGIIKEILAILDGDKTS